MQTAHGLESNPFYPPHQATNDINRRSNTRDKLSWPFAFTSKNDSTVKYTNYFCWLEHDSSMLQQLRGFIQFKQQLLISALISGIALWMLTELPHFRGHIKLVFVHMFILLVLTNDYLPETFIYLLMTFTVLHNKKKHPTARFTKVMLFSIYRPQITSH